jgi:hypothetical protein
MDKYKRYKSILKSLLHSCTAHEIKFLDSKKVILRMDDSPKYHPLLSINPLSLP